MTQTRTYNISITVTVDDEDADLLDILDRRYNSGSLQKEAQRAALHSVQSKGYNGLHRVVLARQGITYGRGFVADHADNDNSNNTRSNLRVITNRQNNLNGKNGIEKQSIYNGLTWVEKTGKWRAAHFSRYNGKVQNKYLGEFLKEVDAAKAYDAYLRANNINKPLNFPEVQHEDHRQASA